MNKLLTMIKHALDRLMKMQETADKVADIKLHTNNEIDKATKTLQQSKQLQTKLLQKTTTYYIGKAVGNIK